MLPILHHASKRPIRVKQLRLKRAAAAALASIILIAVGASAQSTNARKANPAKAIAAAHTTVAPMVVKPGDFSAGLAPYSRYFQDNDRKFDLKQVLAANFEGKFQSFPTDRIDFGFSKSRIWLRLHVQNASATKGQWTLDLQVPYIESMRVWVVRNSGRQRTVQRILHTRDSDPFPVRKIDYRNFATEFSLDGNERAQIVVSYSSTQATQLNAFVRSPDNFSSHRRSKDINNFTLLALLAGITLVTTIYLLAFNPKLAIIFSGYIAISGLYLFHTDGYTFQFLWPDWPNWNRIAVGVIGLTMIACGSLFGRAFVSAKKNFPTLNKLFLFSIAVTCGLALLSIWFLDTTAFKIASLSFVGIPIILQFAAGIQALRLGRLGATMFLIGALAVIAAVIFGNLGYLVPGFIDHDIAANFGRYALIVESMAFSSALFLSIQSVREDRDLALQREIEATREKLATSEALLEAHEKHDRALALAETRRQQLAATAHDIKQPLTSLRIAMLRMNADDNEAAQHIRESFDYLEKLTRTNLEQTRQDDVASNDRNLVSGFTSQVTVTDEDAGPNGLGAREKFPLNVVLKNVHAMFKDEASNKGLELRLVPSTIHAVAEPIALMRMVSNLVSNAIKYTQRGRVLVGVRPNGGKATIKIYDTGAGFSEEEGKRFVEPYQRGEQPGGSGLGLSVVSDLARQHAIDFNIASEPGRGTVCTLDVERAVIG